MPELNETPRRTRRRPSGETATSLEALLARKIIGQQAAIATIAPVVQMYQAGLSPDDQPAGAFLLLGPTGTGKTRTVEALAEILHGSARHVVKIDCGEFHLEHEVAKLIGAPPGYLGHRETHPVLTQARLASVTSPQCDLSIVLFDEVEKAAPSLTRLVLGILDKATLRLGDNTAVNFEKSLIFFTSNLGASAMMKALGPAVGFPVERSVGADAISRRMESIAMAAVRRHFAPEFVNRIDAFITYHTLTRESLELILDQQIALLQRHIIQRLGVRAFRLDVPQETRALLLDQGCSLRFGARELRRTLHRLIAQPLAALVADGQVEPGGSVRAELGRDQESIMLRAA